MSPVGNERIEEARDYHAATKHSYWSIRSGSHVFDWENRPLLFKLYPDLPAVPLPRDVDRPTMAALDAVSGLEAAWKKPLDLRLLAEVLYFCAGLTKKKIYPGGDEHHFRAAAGTGALYEVEVYAACGDLPGLSAGVYHFSPADFALRRLRDGDHCGELVRVSAGDQAVTRAPVTLVLTAIAWRNAWKYRARAYRHFFWNGGTMLANLLATAVSEALASRVVLGFLDARVDHLLGIDGEREASLCLVPLGSGAVAPVPPEVAAISPATLPLSRQEVAYPQIGRIRASSVLASDEEIRAWRAAFERRPSPLRCERRYPLDPSGGMPSSVRTLADVILRRGSTRRFVHSEIPFSHLSIMLDRSTGGMPADFLAGPDTSLIDTYVIANAVTDLPSGAYYFSREERVLELLKAGAFRREAGYLCLEQELGADAGAVVFFLTDLEWVLKRYGNRGYGAAQLESGVIGGKLYLCAYALGLGATGTTFYDDEVTAFFSPHAQGKAAMFAVALGRASRVPGRAQLLKPGER